MTIEQEEHNADDIVVIEQRDKRTLGYIAVAASLGLAFGGLIGSTYQSGQWQKSYQILEQQHTTLLTQKQALESASAKRELEIDAEVIEQSELAVAQYHQEVEAKLKRQQHQISELEKVNLALESRLKDQQSQIDEGVQHNANLNRQNEMQATVFARSRELFQHELKVKQALTALEKEREMLEPAIPALQSQCDVYLEGKSWDAKSDSCDRLDSAQSRLTQIDQMMEVHRMDLREIEVISAEMGL
ncbi:chromosome partitioning protein ParA [Vibrio sp. SM6]|uniref:Chromosome partitioning protein ParA n=1 Tax=Vibrio agarilyticus TaxID=2726741 RepID=A0A7X8TPC6_9VIBR|nr:chromosome partitioning protein ParA [Vibrio agarilyticus]